MRLLVVHQNFPGQFGQLVVAWAARTGWDVRGLGTQTAPGLDGFPQLVRYRLARSPHQRQHPYLRQMEAATLHGQATARAMLQLRQSGFTPDAIVAHPGWGETLYAKDVFPDTRLVHYCEWFYNAVGSDIGFDPEFPATFDDRARIRTWNALHTLNLSHCDAAVTPTHWQKAQHPAIFHPKIAVRHEGIATHELSPDPTAAVKLASGAVLRAGEPVVTYVARNLEPYRGFHVFMRALERIQAAHPQCHAVIVGGDGVSYGKRPTKAANWREQMLREVSVDPTRTHFVGRLSRAQYIRVLQVSAAHVYLTYPFILSWSLLEAMACGANIVASDTPPVREVLDHGRNATLTGFHDVRQLAEALLTALEEGDKPARQARSLQARQDAVMFDHGAALNVYDELVQAAPARSPGVAEATSPTSDDAAAQTSATWSQRALPHARMVVQPGQQILSHSLLHAQARLVGPRTAQRFGQRPPGLTPAVRQSDEWEALRREIYTKAIRLQHGVTYDFRVMLTEARNVRTAGRLMWQLIKPLEPEVLLGPGFGATPLLFSTASAALDDGVELRVLMVRDQRKGHNRKRWIEGDHEAAAGKRTLFIDDFMRHGSALDLINKALDAEKLSVELIGAALFYDMWDPLVSRQLTAQSFPVVALYTRHDMGLSRDCFDARPPLMKGSFAPFIGGKPRWWRFSINTRRAYPKKCAPVIATGAVFVADDHSTLWKHDLRTGDILWSVNSVQQPLKGVVQLLQHVDDSIVYGCYDGTVTRVSDSSGEILWRRRIDSSIHATPSIDAARSRLFINTEQWNEGQPIGHAQCLDLATGEVLWKHRHAWWPPGSTLFCAAHDIVIAPCNDQSVTALDAVTGAVLWKAKTLGLVRGRPAIRDESVFVATELGRLHSFDVRTGATKWVARTGERQQHQFLVIVDDAVILFDGKWHTTALDAVTGKLRWIARLRSPGCWGPTRYGRYLVALSEDGHVAVISPEDEVKVWEGSVPGTYHQPPAVGEGMLVIASSSAGLIAYDVDPSYHPETQSA
jgi:outer membrane protein assembly factor BamB/glycosyltransferase involved in cell wall biosynthesis/orotate phosphoribosyltransferase